MTGKIILIVEDDGLIAAYLQDTLIRLGYTTPEPVATGEAALAAVGAAHPDLILMDIQLAGAMNGVTAAERIREHYDIPVVYLTAFSQDIQLQQAKMTTPYGYLVKPVSERELLATLEMALHRYALDRQLKESEQRLTLALWGADLGMWDWDARSDTVVYNERWAEMLGYRLDEIARHPRSWETRIHPDDLAAAHDAFNAHLENRTAYFEIEHRLRHKDGHYVWVLSKGKVIERDPQGKPLRACGTHLDITQQKQQEEQWRQLAATDPLTGAFNRRYFLNLIEPEISRAQRYARPLTLIMFDIDHFKQVNDDYGHEQGDEVLKTITVRVRLRLRHSDVFVRWGGEEFLILAVETALQPAVALAETLWAALRDAPFPGIGLVTASFGVTEYQSGETLDRWLRRVDDLMYQAKTTGRDRICYGETA